MGQTLHTLFRRKHKFFFSSNISIRQAKIAISLALCCFLLYLRCESGNAASISERTQLAKLKRAHSDSQGVEHVAREKRCTAMWGGCRHDHDCCTPAVCKRLLGGYHECFPY